MFFRKKRINSGHFEDVQKIHEICNLPTHVLAFALFLSSRTLDPRGVCGDKVICAQRIHSAIHFRDKWIEASEGRLPRSKKQSMKFQKREKFTNRL